MDLLKTLASLTASKSVVDSTLVQKAITKLQTEIEQNKSNNYINVVGDFLIQHLRVNPESAEKILNKDKTIGNSLKNMSQVASKRKVGNCAVLTSDEGFKIVLNYFEIGKDSGAKEVNA